MKNETNTLNYVKTKKNMKNLKWRRAPVGKPTTKRQMYLDRIERKLDELLKRQPTINITQPGTWTMPYPYPTIVPEQPTHTPVDPYGNPTIYCSSNGGTR